MTVAFGPVLFAPLVGRSSQRLLAVTAAGFWFAAIQVGGDGLPLYRFAIPQLPAIAVLTAFVVGHIHTHVARDHGPATAGLTAAGAAALILVTGVSSPVSSRYSLYLAQRHVELPRWTAVGRWLRSNAHPGESIAAVPIGAVSYFSGLTAVDMLGLTDRHIAHVTMTEMGHGWAGHEKHDGAYVLNLRPTYLLLGNIDVTSQPRDRSARPFIPVRSAAVLARERDILDSPLLESLYEPASALVAPGAFLNYYRLRADRQPR